MKTLKLSHSIISQWKEGKYEEAIGQYLGKPFPATPAMELGSLYDKKWSKYIEDTGELPPELGGGKLTNPRVQIKYAVRLPLSEEYEILLRGVPDLTEDTAITDFKCGRTEANSYVGKMQLDYYALFKPQATVGRYICFNPYKNTKTVGIKFLTQENRDNAINEIVTYGADILQYLLANKLFIDYKEN
jgi:hypothetical protein